MSTLVRTEEELPSNIEQTITEAEKASVAQFEDQRRYNLLRYIVPTIMILSGVALPFGIYSDITSQTFASTPENTIVFVGCVVSYWAMRRRLMDLSSQALFLGVTGTLYLLIAHDTLFSGPLSQGTLSELTLLLFPIVLAGVTGSPALCLAMTFLTPAFTFLVITLPQHDAAFTQTINSGGALGIYIDPMATQIAMGVLILVTTNSLRRTQRELNTTRIAYRRERELDRLKNRFISNVNHELRTPLMSMRGYIVLSRELGKRQDPEQQDYMLSRGLETVGHMEGIVESILDVRRTETRNTALVLAPVNAHAAITKAVRLIDARREGEPERNLFLSVDGTLIVMAEEETLGQVLINLLSNACKYSAPGSAIEIIARPRPSYATAPKGEQRPPMVEIAIRDHGLGIPPDQIPLLFQRFVRLDRDLASPIPGTGLGLAICRAYVEAMGGTIWVESTGEPGEGSTFTFTLHQALAETAASLG
jgi:signal transduction histidine kinase